MGGDIVQVVRKTPEAIAPIWELGMLWAQTPHFEPTAYVRSLFLVFADETVDIEMGSLQLRKHERLGKVFARIRCRVVRYMEIWVILEGVFVLVGRMKHLAEPGAAEHASVRVGQRVRVFVPASDLYLPQTKSPTRAIDTAGMQISPVEP